VEDKLRNMTIKKFKATEKVVRFIESDNTLVVEVNLRDDKEGLKKEAERILGVKIDRVNTFIRNNKKYAYLKVNKKTPAIDVATKFGVI